MKLEVLRKLGLRPNKVNFEVLRTCLSILSKYADLDQLPSWDAPVLPRLSELSPKEREFLRRSIGEEVMTLGECQSLVQRGMDQVERKRYAAYYTTRPAVEFIASVAKRYSSNRGGLVVADPFLGSGRLLSRVVAAIGAEKLNMVWGIEPMPLPALVAFTSLLLAVEGRRDLVIVQEGDAFKELREGGLPKTDVVVTNPPFTRWNLLSREERGLLLEIFQRDYRRYLTRGGASLQVLSMFLVDSVLREGGLLAAVLPASTFYTLYGRGYKELLRERYRVLGLIQGEDSFSEGSGFKEVILVAVKERVPGGTVFTRLASDPERMASGVWESAGGIDLRSIPSFLDMNWLSLFDSHLREVVLKFVRAGLKSGMLGRWREVLRADLVRGVEMYGPDFFFLPNRYWRLSSVDAGELVFGSTDENMVELSIPRAYLVKALRRPSLYSKRIDVEVNTYLLSLPPVPLEDLPGDIRRYVMWGVESGTASPAIRSKGDKWYSHVYLQLKSKEPFGHLFLPDKIGSPLERGVIANLSMKRVTASKNFYVVKSDLRTAEILAAWFNSAFFVSMIVLLGRKISEGWTRFLLADYLELPVLNCDRLSEEAVYSILKALKSMSGVNLKSIAVQISESTREELDLAIARALKLDDPSRFLESLYDTLLGEITSPHP